MRRFIIIVIVLGVLGAAFFFWRQNQVEAARAETLANLQTEIATEGELTATVGATGVVRSNQSAQLSWQTTGTVGEVNVALLDAVEEGSVIASISQTTLPQGIILAQADLVSAQQALDELRNTALQEAQALKAVEDAEQALEDLLNIDLQQALAQQAIADAEQAVTFAERRLTNVQSTASQANIDAAEAQVVIARDALDRAKERFEPYENKPEDNLVRANLQSQLAAAQQQYDFAVRNLNALQGTGSETDISVAQANLSTAQAQLIDAERNWERIKDGPTDAEVALLEAQLKDANENYESIRSGADPEDVEAAEARVAAAEATLRQANMEAPFSGVVTSVNTKVGDQVSPGLPAFRIDDLSSLLVDVDISEVDINRITIGQEASISLDAVTDKEYNGRVTEVSLVGTTVAGVVSFRVTIELINPDASVRPGMTAGINVVVNKLENVLLVPNRAVRLRNGERVVYVYDEAAGELTPVDVQLGASSELYSEVLSGDVNVGDAIVLNPPNESFFGGGPPGGPPGGN